MNEIERREWFYNTAQGNWLREARRALLNASQMSLGTKGRALDAVRSAQMAVDIEKRLDELKQPHEDDPDATPGAS